MNQTILDILCDARARLAEPSRWAQGAHARDDEGESCMSSSPHARSWCISSAVIHADGLIGIRLDARALLESIVETDLTAWNDEPKRTHAEVIGLFDRAIAQLVAEGEVL